MRLSSSVALLDRHARTNHFAVRALNGLDRHDGGEDVGIAIPAHPAALPGLTRPKRAFQNLAESRLRCQKRQESYWPACYFLLSRASAKQPRSQIDGTDYRMGIHRQHRNRQ